MKYCLSCRAVYPSSSNQCPQCGMETGKVDDFLAYAPALAHEASGFKANYFVALERVENTNFWFRSRNDLLLWMLRRYCGSFSSVLEIGCGTGYVLTGISKAFPTASLFGSEIFTAGLKFAASRLPQAMLMQMDAREIPYVDEFDVIGAFDVLEHIQEDERVLSQIHSALREDGYLLVTVPQHRWLWSQTDDLACHVRRYHAGDLHDKIVRAGFEIVRSTSFVTLLLPAMMLSRLLQRKADRNRLEGKYEFELSPWLNWLFFQIMKLERVGVRSGVDFPVGGSRLVVAKKAKAAKI